MAPKPDGMATMASERQNMRQAAAHKRSHKGEWKVVAHRPHPTTDHIIEETWGYYDSEEEAQAARVRKERPNENVRLGVEQVE